MKKKVLSVLLAGCICCPMMAMASYGETPVHALTIIASVTNISVFKDTIAVGESVQLELEWSTGAEQMVYYSSSDESIATVNQNGLVTGIGNGTAIITLSHSNIGTDKTIAINVSEDAEISKTYNTSELTLEAKLKKYDTLHYTGTGAGSCLNVVNTEGGYTPVLLIDDYIITSSENGLESEQYYRVVTANGSRYSTEAFVVDTELGYEWTVKDDVNLIMTEGEKEQYITDEEVLRKISEFTKNAAKYKDCEMKNLNSGVSDYGEETLYVLYNEENGTMQQLELCRFGDDCAWLDNTEVQEFVTLLIEKVYFANSSILEDYLKNKE